MTLKQKLSTRAWRYGEKLSRLAVFGSEVGQVAFEAGYRAAMRDARKAFHEGRHAGNIFYLAAPMQKFLRPLR